VKQNKNDPPEDDAHLLFSIYKKEQKNTQFFRKFVFLYLIKFKNA
jgi:hypothetical protein